jgi:glycosyltransferase involved in cell wall biosynthesis
VGGAERYVLELARHMANRRPTTLLTFGERAREETTGRLRIKVLRRAWRVRGQDQNPLAIGLLREVLSADVVHCHQQHVLASSVAAVTARVSGRRPFVTDLGGGGWDVSAYISTDRWYEAHLHISEYSRRIYGHSGKAWAHVIYGGVDATKFTPAPGDTARHHGGRAALFVGRLLAHKGVNDLLDAAPPDLPVALIGQPYDEVFFRDLQRLAVGKNVVFRGGVGDEELIAAYQQALCIVLPSVYRSMYGDQSKVPELLGQTLLEGMACGVPVICTAVASMPEVVQDGVTGFVVPPNDPAALRARLTWLAAHPDDAAQMGAAGRQRVLRRFTWEAVVERCVAIYDRNPIPPSAL